MGGGGQRGVMETERDFDLDFDLGNGCMMLCADNVLLSSTLRTHMVL